MIKTLYYTNKNLASEDMHNNEWQKVKDLLIKKNFLTKFIDDQMQKKKKIRTN